MMEKVKHFLCKNLKNKNKINLSKYLNQKYFIKIIAFKT